MPGWQQPSSMIRLTQELKPSEKLGFLVLCMAAASGLFILERVFREHDTEPRLANRRQQIPNYNHLWSAHDMLFVNSDAASGQLTRFGRDFLLHDGDWGELCKLDSDGDGHMNGEELGDPCCRWKSSDAQHAFHLSSQEEYRRWVLSDPGVRESVPLMSAVPKNCSVAAWHHGRQSWMPAKYDPVVYDIQYHKFYYDGLDRPAEAATFETVQMCCFAFFLLTLLQWIWKQNFLEDLLPRSASKIGVGFAIFVLSFFYLDLFSGVVHIVLDYAPQWLPVLGRVAYGTQLHHHDPTNFLQESPVDHVGHVHLILPLMPVLVFASDGSGSQRLWWFWCAIWAHLFQFTHRWSHMPREELAWPMKLAQDHHLLLHRDWHMQHHQDHSLNFCFLSGQVGTDSILNFATKLMPPIRYDFWLTCMLAMLFVPVLLDGLSSTVSKQADRAATMAETTPLMAAMTSEAARLGLCVVAAALLYFLPWLILLSSYCAEFGCFRRGCKMDQCLPSLSATVVYSPGSPSSYFRLVLGHVASLIRAPVMAYILYQAYQRVRGESRKSEFRGVFMCVALYMMAACDVSATLIQHTSAKGPSMQIQEIQHVAVSVGFFIALLGGVAPAYASAVNRSQRQSRGIWIVWLILVTDALWLIVSWFTTVGRSAQWYVSENFLAGPGVFALFLTIGLTVPPADTDLSILKLGRK